jgi:hypothetical protein
LEFVERTLRDRLSVFKDRNVTIGTLAGIHAVMQETLKTGVESCDSYHGEAKFNVSVSAAPSDPDVVVIDISPVNLPARSYMLYLNEHHPEMFPLRYARPPEHIVLDLTLKGDHMEKNGNTFVPGDTVRSANTKGKTASQSTGTVRPETSEGRLKVAWQDGTESWEKPEDLNRG